MDYVLFVLHVILSWVCGFGVLCKIDMDPCHVHFFLEHISDIFPQNENPNLNVSLQVVSCVRMHVANVRYLVSGIFYRYWNQVSLSNSMIA